MYSLGEVNFIQGMHDLGNCKNSVGLKPIAVRLRQTRSDARSQALPGNVFLAALPPVQFVVQQGRNNAPVLAIKTINAKLRQGRDRLGLKPQAILCRP